MPRPGLPSLRTSVHEVRRPRAGHLFHPKLWVLRYRSDDDAPQFRLLCLTRNLTREHSWDEVLRLDGGLTGVAKSGNRPLAHLIRALPGLTTTPLADERRKRITGLAEDLRRIAWDYQDDVNEIRFHVYGVRDVASGADFYGYQHLVIAPFLNERGIAKVAPDSPNAAVVSRIEDLDRLSLETAPRITPYIVSSIAGLDEPDGTEGLEDGKFSPGSTRRLRGRTQPPSPTCS